MCRRQAAIHLTDFGSNSGVIFFSGMKYSWIIVPTCETQKCFFFFWWKRSQEIETDTHTKNPTKLSSPSFENPRKFIYFRIFHRKIHLYVEQPAVDLPVSLTLWCITHNPTHMHNHHSSQNTGWIGFMGVHRLNRCLRDIAWEMLEKDISKNISPPSM